VQEKAMADYVVVLTTVAESFDAEGLARSLVAERLAACVNVLPRMTSVYRWEGAVESAGERQLLLKTSAAREPDLRRRVAELHPYDTPEWLVLTVAGGSDRYLAWLLQSVTPEP
jgi:periplasmic divalent cation tolerance protein